MHSQQYINRLYNELIMNSPQMVTVDIPRETGVGRIVQTTSKHGIMLSDWKLSFLSEMNLKGIVREEYIQLNFCFNEGMSWDTADRRYSLELQTGESCFYKGNGKMEYACYKGKRDFHFKSIRLPYTYFSYLLTEYFENSEICAYTEKLLGNVLKVVITPHMERLLTEMNDFTRYSGGMGHLYLESKITELLTVYLSEALQISPLNNSNHPIYTTDKEAILEAKRILDNQLSYAPGCKELADRVYMSVSGLSKGFKAMTGKPIHAYIIDRRLEKAACLLLESKLSISQISTITGYAKPSNFSAAFKKKYGIVPKQYRNNF